MCVLPGTLGVLCPGVVLLLLEALLPVLLLPVSVPGFLPELLVPTLDFSSLDFSLSLLLEFASCFSSDLSLSESLLESDDVSDDFVSELFVSLLGLELACLSELLE